MSVAAYKQSMRDTVSPRELEAKVFAQVIADLEACANDSFALIRAVDRNRRFWGTLVADLADVGNLLPNELKAALVSIGLWVNRYSGQVLTQGLSVAPLIDINRTIMKGLVAPRAG